MILFISMVGVVALSAFLLPVAVYCVLYFFKPWFDWWSKKLDELCDR